MKVQSFSSRSIAYIYHAIFYLLMNVITIGKFYDFSNSSTSTLATTPQRDDSTEGLFLALK